MSKNIIGDLPKLIEAGIIDESTADNIAAFYRKKEASQPNRILAIFGVIGAVLVGMGIILILAHNWDDLSRGVKTALAFSPLLLGQGMVGYALRKKQDSPAWLESTAAFLFFAIGAVIALISQIYNIPGNLSNYLLTWMVLAIPLFYLTRSTTVAIFSLIGITYYAYTTTSIFTKNPVPLWYWAYLPAIFLYYWQLYKRNPNSNGLNFFHWLVPISVATTLFMITRHPSSLMLLAYFSLFGLFYWFGGLDFIKNKPLFSNGYRVIGTISTIGMLLFFSFNEFWKDVFKNPGQWQNVEVIAVIALIAATVYLIFRQYARGKIQITDLVGFAFLLFIPIFFVGLYVNPTIATIAVNIALLAFGIATILKGTNRNNLAVMNFGLLIIAALIIARFFDLNLSFVFRGVLFILIGLGFWYGNYHFIKQRKQIQQ